MWTKSLYTCFIVHEFSICAEWEFKDINPRIFTTTLRTNNIDEVKELGGIDWKAKATDQDGQWPLKPYLFIKRKYNNNLRLRTNFTSNDVNCTFTSDAFSASFLWLVKFLVILNESIFWRNDIADPTISKS